jgi:antitoxin component YwqK of YwqJK toxin-antitoxin module
MIIDEAELDLDEDIRLYEGKPFTGIARAYHPDKSIRKELPFLNGFREGLCKEWHSNGCLHREWVAVRGVIDGKACEWHANGAMKSIAHYSRGVELSYEEWDDNGTLIMERQINKQSELYKYVSERQK